MIFPKPPDHSRGLTISQLILSIAGILLSLLGLVVILLLVFAAPLLPNFDGSQPDQLIPIAWITGLIIALTVPSLVLSWQRLRGRISGQPSGKNFLVASLGLLLIPLLVLTGRSLIEQGAPAWQTAPINLLLVILPVWWFIEFSRFRLRGGSAQRLWGLSNFSMYLTMPFIFFVEIILIGIGVIFASFWLFQQPEFAPVLSQIEQQFMTNQLDLQSLNIDFGSMLLKPEIIIAVVAAITVFIPIVEELLKPLALWVLVKKNLSPAEGFIAGVICGASFAILESVSALVAVPADNWLLAVIGRVGTGLLHVATAGLNGWALASTWKDGRYLRLGLTYFLTVLTHGFWNFFALLMGVSAVGNELPLSVNPALSQSAVWVLGGLSLIMVTTLVIMNRRLRTPEAPSSFPPPLPIDVSIQ